MQLQPSTSPALLHRASFTQGCSFGISPSTCPGNPDASFWRIFVRGTLNSLLNPKALLFFMVFLPQFVTVTAGDVGLQLISLGTLLALIALLFHTLLGIFAGQLRAKLFSGRISRRLGTYGFAGVMTALAARLLFLERPL